jgi:thioredoxin 1
MYRQNSIGLIVTLMLVGLVVAVKAPEAAAAPTALPQLIELFSPTCPHCQRMVPVIDKVRAQVQGKAEILAIDIGKNAVAADKYQVSAIPTLIFLDAAGKEVFRHVGEYPADDILAKMRELGWR